MLEGAASPGVVTTGASGCAEDDSPRLCAAQALRKFLHDTDWSHMTYRRQQILEAFVSIASTKGYESVTMRNIGECVDMKAPSIYRHFRGREEIVTEAYRWHFYRFATAVLEAVDQTSDVQSFWRSLVRVHLQRQLKSPENDMWDILMASDRIGGFLPADARREYTEWLNLYDKLYVAAALELGYRADDVDKFVRVVVKILDTANEWCRWDGTEEGLRHCVEQAITISEALLRVDLSQVPATPKR
ncbi:TetR/AcrR family transcriptional regulator [Mycolicibacterium sp.]|uniref:TetR/AcrR family transcriptional regulator n=1 Tax=Mycolicibacterium sp. TaxID=2320850 RepID=UPI0037C7B896